MWLQMLSTKLQSYIDNLPVGYLRHYGFRIDNVNQKNDYGGTLLHYASGNEHFEMVQELINQGADVNVKRYDMITPLWLAVHRGYPKITQFLIAQGSDVNVCDDCKVSTLHLASMNGDPEIVQELLNNGADTNIHDNEGKSPLDIAKTEEIKQIIINYEQTPDIKEPEEYFS